MAPRVGDTGKAFAICISRLQKTGILKKGTKELTAKGKKAERKHKSEPEAGAKLAAYEKAIKRKGESLQDNIDRLKKLLEEADYDWHDLEIEVRDLLAVMRQRNFKKMTEALDKVNEIAMAMVEKEMEKK